VTDGPFRPDYGLDETVRASTPEQFKALSHPLRHQILGLLNQRAATLGQLADALGCLRGTVSHHLKVLEAAGLARVVRTRPVRGGTEQYWGRTAWIANLDDLPDVDGRAVLLDLVRGDLAPDEPDTPGTFGLRRVRLEPEQARELAKRLDEVFEQFDSLDSPHGKVYGLVLGLYASKLPTLPQPAWEAEPEPEPKRSPTAQPEDPT
jgi:DNA-binding transcriptional ArsR family regulator